MALATGTSPFSISVNSSFLLPKEYGLFTSNKPVTSFFFKSTKDAISVIVWNTLPSALSVVQSSEISC